MEYIADSSINPSNCKLGFLREHSGKASGKDPLTGLHRTGLDKYLEVIVKFFTDAKKKDVSDHESRFVAKPPMSLNPNQSME